jgi:hypothetical protein
MDTLDTAKSWIDKGYSVIPIAYRSKRPAFDALKITGCFINGEIKWEMFKDRQATPEELRIWFTGPKRNVGVVTGFNNLVVLDFDTLEFYSAWAAWADSVGGYALEVKAQSYRVYTSRGIHLYIHCTEPVESYSIEHSVDVKAKWGYVLAPPSIHPSGHEYRGVGERIICCEQLSDVFPLSRPEPESLIPTAEMNNDPWDVADKAVFCNGQGAIERIHVRLSVSDILGVSLNGHRTVLVRCPLHDDQNPSMLVYADGHCRCLAGCQGGKQMDSIDLYAAIHHISNREAIALLDQQ